MFEDDLDDAREVILESRGPGRPGRVPKSRPRSRAECAAPTRRRPLADVRLGRTAFEMTSREGLTAHERSVIAAVAGAALAAGLAECASRRHLRGRWPLCSASWVQPDSCTPLELPRRGRPSWAQERTAAGEQR